MKQLINVSPMEIKRGIGYINKIETPTSGETIFVKGKDKTLNPVAPSSIPP